MPKKSKTLCVDDLRHAEYYGMQGTFDELYQKSQNGEVFENLMDLILSRDNILLAYRNIKANKGSYTAGTDKKNITDIGSQTPDDVVKRVRFIVTGSEHGYRPKPVRRKDIPKPNGETRPLGIPCIWDRLIQQCIKQIMEPICEAKFSNNSYGFRPNRSVEHAINRTYTMLQMMNLHYVIEFDIKGFFDNVNHSKLIRQIWSLGIHDKTLIFIIKRILTAPIKMPDNTTVLPNKGTPQGGIISPLLANIVLNELDWWIASQWEENPIAISKGRERIIGKTKVFDKSHGYRIMKNTEMKEMHIIRYADDFRIFCRTKEDAVRTKEAVTAWIEERLKLGVSPEKTRIVNTRKRWSEFLGFKIRVRLKHHKYVVQSAICDKKVEIERAKLVEQAKNIAKPREKKSCLSEIQLYNSMVLGIQNYYQLATCISIDCREFHEGREEEKNFNTLLEMINASEAREDDENFKNSVDLMFDELEQKDPNHFAVRQYKKYKLAAGKTAKSILISCGARLAPFDIAELRELMSYDELELDLVGDRKTALFVIISDTDDTFNFIVSIMYTQLFNLLCDRADDVYGGRLPIHVRCLLDEFANIGQIPKFEKLIATIRSREISASIILQSKSQLKAIYKDNADTIEGNCDTTLFLGGKEKTTLKEIAEILGKETIDLYNTSDTRGSQRSYGMNYQKTGKELMSQDEIAVMDGGKCILQVRGVRPFFSNKYDICKHKNYKYLSDYDKKNTFDIEKYLSTNLILKPEDEVELYQM